MKKPAILKGLTDKLDNRQSCQVPGRIVLHRMENHRRDVLIYLCSFSVKIPVANLRIFLAGDFLFCNSVGNDVLIMPGFSTNFRGRLVL